MYRVGCDIGGTFTDLVVLDTEREALHTAKGSRLRHSESFFGLSMSHASPR